MGFLNLDPKYYCIDPNLNDFHSDLTKNLALSNDFPRIINSPIGADIETFSDSGEHKKSVFSCVVAYIVMTYDNIYFQI